jgi:hypothetical protein
MSSKRMLTNNQEVAVDFLNTHLAMVVFLMPWKRITVTAGGESQNGLFSLFNFLNIDPWVVGMDTVDDTLVTKTHTFIGLSVVLLVSCILSFATSVFYAKDVGVRFGLDFINFALGSVILILAVTFQSDFDAYWKFISDNAPSGAVVDYEQMFLVVGVLVGQIVLSLLCMADKFKDVYEKLY